MTDSPEVFFEVFEGLPRQGPGNFQSTQRALSGCTELPSAPRVLDLGCGAGAQTLHLAALTTGTLHAVDAHAPLIDRLRAHVVEQGLTERVHAQVGDMAALDLPPESFDLIWSEGALYNVGLPAALSLCSKLLRPRGYLAFTEAVWRTTEAPAEVREAFADYPAMGTVDDVKLLFDAHGFVLVDHFLLPDEAWWDDFYAPMERRISELRSKYVDDVDALAALDEIAKEPKMHRAHGTYYGYAFFVVRRADCATSPLPR